MSTETVAAAPAAPRGFTTWAVQFEDRNGVARNREFPTEAARTRFLDKGEESGAVTRVRAVSDPQ